MSEYDLHRKNEILFYHREAGRAYNKHQHNNGWPDLYIFYNGKTIFVELKKDEKYMLNDKQRLKKVEIKKAGFLYYICWTYDGFKLILDNNNIKYEE